MKSVSQSKIRRVPKETHIIGRNIRHMRKSAGLSQGEIAKVLDVSFQQIQKYECGENRFPIEKLHKLKIFLGMPYGRFFEGLTGEQDVSSQSMDMLYARLSALPNKDLKQKIKAVLTILLD